MWLRLAASSSPNSSRRARWNSCSARMLSTRRCEEIKPSLAPGAQRNRSTLCPYPNSRRELIEAGDSEDFHVLE
jgi:hypothetical protein